MENDIHPGYIDIKALSEKAGPGEKHFDRFAQLLKEERLKVSFEDFSPFIKTNGLKEDEKNRFIDLLKSIYKIDNGVSWTPGNCSHADYLAEQIRSIIIENSRFSGLKADAMRFYRSHFWIEVKGFGEKVLVIDPFGIPKNFPDVRLDQGKNILPYFGMINFAPKSTKLVYRKGKLLDNWVTRDLPPSFHP